MNAYHPYLISNLKSSIDSQFISIRQPYFKACSHKPTATVLLTEHTFYMLSVCPHVCIQMAHSGKKHFLIYFPRGLQAFNGSPWAYACSFVGVSVRRFQHGGKGASLSISSALAETLTEGTILTRAQCNSPITLWRLVHVCVCMGLAPQ